MFNGVEALCTGHEIYCGLKKVKLTMSDSVLGTGNVAVYLMLYD